MVFSSLVFLFAYLPITLLAYYLVPRQGRNIFLFIVNLIFYGWGEPKLVLLMVFNIFFNYIGGWLVDKYRADAKKKKLFLILTCVLDIGILAVFKYTGMITETLNMLPFLNIPELQISLPIGISFYTFQTMSYVIDVYRDDAPVSKNFINFGTYVALFPQLIAGPIVRYRDVAEQLVNRRETLEMFTRGVKLFMVGLAKKVIIANTMGTLTTNIFATTDENGVVGTWVGIIAYTFQIYFDFSGYSDMACGLGNMLGFEFLKNFNYPYIAKSITDFWRRWHISLSTWFKEYVYIPLGGNRKGVKRQILNLLIVWGLTGLWHGAAYNFVLWGLYYGLLLILEKFVLKKFLDRLPSFVQHIYTLFIVIIGWGLFYFTDVGQLGEFMADLFNFGNGICGNQAFNLIMSNLPMLIIAAVASTPLAAMLYNRFEHTRFMWIPETLYCMGVLAVSTASLVNQSYNPFLYFRF
ncbi:MBOAT family O-acyltransferase [Ruminococcus bromii]|uniref:D-alanyl-lipoteichoic acid biosynthesis protein DltB n=1 Tax=Ruminococcus bromii TaxID=40518 RepID=A0A2N0V0R3_9FIRM|nr:MBOAT family O-acyltransferase [Ruminococcus bromii]PKD32812.1 D-alanyl-lipoteichoic acid biosynthesis protein DltB [Ruminococcus bromii]